MADPEYVQVYGTYVTANGSPEIGKVVIRPIVHASYQGDNYGLVTMGPIDLVLGQNGEIEVGLIASDDPAWLMDGPVPYKVHERMYGSQRGYYVYIYGPGPVNLAEVERMEALDLVLPEPLPQAVRRHG